MRLRLLPLLLAPIGCAGSDGDGFAPAQTEDTAPDTGPFDEDGDGFIAQVDCDDQDPEVYPGAFERSYDGVDNDCDPSTPDDDLDQDGFPRAEDCDDQDPTRSPALPDIPCDGRDQDCSGVADDAGSTVVRAISHRGVLPRGAALTVELSDPPDALDPSAVRLHGEVSGLISGTLSAEGSALRFEPDRPPAPGERLHLTLHPLPSAGGQGVCLPHVSTLYAGAEASDASALAEREREAVDGALQALLSFDGADSGRPQLLTQLGEQAQAHALGGWAVEASLALPTGAQLAGAADLDMDGAPDLIAFTDDAVYTAFGGEGWAAEPWARVALDYAQIVELAPADVDGDGDLDLIAAVYGDLGGADRVHVLYNDDTGLLVPSFRGEDLTGRPRSMTPGDVDADGDIDVIVSTSGATLETLINDGAGNLSLDLSLPTSARLHGLKAADLDQDGDVELIAAADDGELWVISSEDAVLNTLHQRTLGFVAASSQLADWDADGDLDVLAIGADGLTLLASQEDHSLLTWSQLPGADLATPLDHDGDGDLELVSAQGAELILYDAP